MSWILEEDRLLKIQHNHPREPMESIKCYFLYLNSESSIDNVSTDTIPLDWNDEKACKYISKERVLQLIQEKRKRVGATTQYVFKDACMFLIDLEPEHVQTYANSDGDGDVNSFLVKLPIVDDIFVQPSIFVFHGTNSLYFIFQEIRSILRRGGSATRKHVLIGDDNNKTRKNLNI
jgi:hypothetical protein